MMNPIEEMRRLSSKCYEELVRLAITNFGFCPNGEHISKVEIITYIVAITAARDRFAEKNSGRKKYQITTVDNETYYVKLTPEQVKFLDWCLDAEICFSDANAHELDDIEWETP